MSTDPTALREPRGDAAPHRLALAALAAAEAATAVHLRRLGRIGADEATDKGRFDFVTEVDLEAQAAALAVLRRAFPGHAVLAEEAGDGDDGAPSDGTPLWIVDPLDGTTNFMHGHPAFCASVGVVVGGEPVAGAVVAGLAGERYVGWKGGGAWMAGGRSEGRAEGAGAPAPPPPGLDAGFAPIGVSRTSSLRTSLVATGFPFKRPDEIEDYVGELARMLRRSSGVRRDGAAALDLCRLARGTFDAFWEGTLAPWDVAGGLAIVGAAGGRWSGPDGTAYDVVRGGPLRAANGNGLLEALHRALQEPV